MQLVTIWNREAPWCCAEGWGWNSAQVFHFGSEPVRCQRSEILPARLLDDLNGKKKSPSFCVCLEQGGDEGTSSSEEMCRKIIIRARVIRIKSSASSAPRTAASCTRLHICREQIESAQVLNAAQKCLYMQNKSGVLPSPRSTLLAGWCWHCLGCCSNKRHAATTKKRKEREKKEPFAITAEKNK